ncbi:hypothetical protein ACGFYV_23885 [Streptomyces sp. NPDC048297]|uniref:hypothetical protein n=1 Tax=Streptomyces sp. NPDC048297 TaxID=3365531 RepID=UPI00371940F8
MATLELPAIELDPPLDLHLPTAEPHFTAPVGPPPPPPPPPPLLLAGDVDDNGSEPHICRGID